MKVLGVQAGSVLTNMVMFAVSSRGSQWEKKTWSKRDELKLPAPNLVVSLTDEHRVRELLWIQCALTLTN